MTKMVSKETASTPPAPPKAGGGPVPPGFRHILGEKLGMTQIFDGGGNAIPVTALRAGPCPVVQIKTAERDGYHAVQIGFGGVREKGLTKAERGTFQAAGVSPVRRLKEFRVTGEGFEVGQIVTLENRFKAGDFVDVRGVTKGKGFAGVMKRHGFKGLPASHGASDKERSPGSLASRRSLGRVLPGQRMAGRMGGVWETSVKLEVVEVLPEENLLYVKGAVPGPAHGWVIVSETVRPLKRRPVRKAAPAKKSKDPLKAAKAAAKGGKK